MRLSITYLPTTTATRRSAARLRAERRRHGRVTADGLDGDVLIAAQAIAELATVVTFNETHFQNLVDAVAWTTVPLADPA